MSKISQMMEINHHSAKTTIKPKSTKIQVKTVNVITSFIIQVWNLKILGMRMRPIEARSLNVKMILLKNGGTLRVNLNRSTRLTH